ncbi:MAG TPA: phosphoribosyltransferase family protein [Acidimicrobiia bacterium]|nr:phosphoribosyltransferase family protein [Acidimicrobiia bacterium]
MLASLFPLVCPGCGRPGEPLCLSCEAGLRAAPLSAPPSGVDRWAAAFAYDGVARELVARVKYRNVRAVVPWLADAMCEALVADMPPAHIPPVQQVLDVTTVTWAPTTPQRRRDRGFDPAELLARHVARRLALPCSALVGRLPGPPQTGLAANARRVGPRFEPVRSRAAARRTFGATVLVVDDVTTTGATLTAAAFALRAAGARGVVALTAARTPPPRRG